MQSLITTLVNRYLQWSGVSVWLPEGEVEGRCREVTTVHRAHLKGTRVVEPSIVH